MNRLVLLLSVLCGPVVVDSAQIGALNTYTDGSPSALWQGVAVQHFTVPHGCLGTQVEFYCDITGGQTLVDHEVALQVYSADRKHMATGAAKVQDLHGGRGWVVVKGLRLKPDTYYAQLFTNSRGLSLHLRACLHSRSNYRGGYAASGWKGGMPLGQAEDFRARLTYERPSALVLRLGQDRRFLVKDGRANYSLVLAVDAPLAEQTAAEELRTHLRVISGATLAILLETEYRGGPMLAVGFNHRLPPTMQPGAFGALQDQQIIIKPGVGLLLLAGAEPRGTLYAVYEFLHRLGVRWYSPDFTFAPSLADIPLPKEGVIYAPPVTGRQICAGIHIDPTWMARNRLTTIAHWSPLGRRYGSPRAEGPDMHTVWRIVPESVIREHPDWASEVKGRRTTPVNINTWDLCYTNQEARRYFIDRTVEWAAAHPEIETVWIGQNDSDMSCDCAECKAFYAAHGGKRSSVIVQLVNDLADALVAAGMTDRTVKTLAYGWSSEPPSGMTVRDNATIMVCDSGQIPAWTRLARHVAVYLYGESQNYWAPSPTLYSDAAKIAGCWRDGATNLYSAISGFGGSYGSDLVDLRSWLAARLMWNPASDPQRLIQDFCRGYYGPAHQAVLESIRLRHTHFKVEAAAQSAAASGFGVPSHVDPLALRHINQVLEKSYQALPAGSHREHLQRAWLSTLWTDFWRGAQGLGRYDPVRSTWTVPIADSTVRRRYGALAKQFMVGNGVNALGEHNRLNPRDLGLDKVGVDWPAHLFRDGSVEAVVVPGVGGMLADLRDSDLGFAPLKACWGGLLLQYPLFSCTEDNVNGRQVTEYRATEVGSSQAALLAEYPDYTIGKRVALEERRLVTHITARAKRRTQLEIMTAVMFDLLDEGLGRYPTVLVEQKEGEWKRRVMGTETSFWWVEGPLDLGHPTGRMVIASQTRPAGISLGFDPQQISSFECWYDNLMNYYPSREQHGMLRLFLRARGTPTQGDPPLLNTGEARELRYTLEILPDAMAAVAKQR